MSLDTSTIILHRKTEQINDRQSETLLGQNDDVSINRNIWEMTSFRDRLEFMLKERNWKQADLVRRSGVSKAVISVLLSDPSKDLRVSSLLSLAKALGCDPLWLYTGKESGTYVSDSNLDAVPVWTMDELAKHPTDALATLDSGRSVYCETQGHLIGLIASDSGLIESGIKPGDICVIDLADQDARHGDIVLANLFATNQNRLLKAIAGLAGITLVTDDPRMGSISLKDAAVLGRMIELRRDVRE